MLATGERRVPQAAANRALVLRLLRFHHRLARAEIALRSGLSEASVSRIVSELVRRGLVDEEGSAQSTGGRPAIRLRLSEERYRSIGIEIQNWETRIAVASLSGRILNNEGFRTPSDPTATLDVIAERVEAEREKIAPHALEGIGVSARGLVDARTGVVEHGNEESWQRIRVREYLQSKLNIPVYVENNVRAAAFAEYHYGSPDVRGAHCLLFVKVDDGIGVSMLLDGRLFYGQHMAAGEFGQMVIADQDSDATHDRPGCWEKLAAAGAICETHRLLNGGRRSAGGGDVIARVRQICHAALAGDETAAAALRKAARYLGIGISNVVWGLDPDGVVIDGAITEAWTLIAPVVREQFADGREFLNFRNLLLRPSALGGQATIIGAAALPFGSLFQTAQHAKIESGG